VDEHQQHEAERELPAPDQAVCGDRHERGRGCREQLDVPEQQQHRLQLREQRHDPGAERADAAPQPRSPRLAERIARGTRESCPSIDTVSHPALPVR